MVNNAGILNETCPLKTIDINLVSISLFESKITLFKITNFRVFQTESLQVTILNLMKMIESS